MGPIFIWQQVFCSKPEVYGLGRQCLMSFPGWLVSVLSVTIVSYYGFEPPLVRLRSAFGHGN
jgi:hypothetical protein